MPIRNEFFGVYKTIKISDNFVLTENAKRNRKMEAAAKSYIQGTPLTKILDIGGVQETIELSAPILIGGGAAIDGRTLLSDQVANVLKRNSADLVEGGATLPLMSKATVSVKEDGASVSFNLESDGKPPEEGEVPPFVITDYDSSYLSRGSDLDVLNPLTNMPTRVAKWWDFRVSMGTFQAYIMNATIDVTTKITRKNFIAGIDDAEDMTTAVPEDNPNNYGTQFPWMGVAGLEISGSGQAAVLLTNPEGDDYYFTEEGHAINVSLGAEGYELTLQSPGETVSMATDFAIQVFDNRVGEGSWRSLFRVEGEDQDLLDLSKAVVTAANFNVTADLLTMDFNFYCWVTEVSN